MPSMPSDSPFHFFVDSIGKSIAETLSREFAAPWSVEVGKEVAPQPENPQRTFGLTLSGNLQGQAAIQIRESDIATLTQGLHRQAEKAGPEPAEGNLETLNRLMQRVVASLATTLQEHFGAIDVHLGSMDAPPNWPGPATTLIASAANVGTLALELRMDETLVTNLPSSASPSATSVVPSNDEPQNPNGNLEVLLGVELDVKLRFGERMLPLREVLNLNSGSVVELERQVQQPAEIMLGEKLLARGEVVLVDGYYGVRVTEVLTTGSPV